MFAEFLDSYSVGGLLAVFKNEKKNRNDYVMLFFILIV